MKNPDIRRRLVELALVVLGNLIYAITVVLFILPSRVMSCGTTGIALVLEHLWHIPISGFVLVFNLLMLLLGWLVLGRAFVMTTVLSSLLYPVLLEVCQRVLGDGGITENMLLNTVAGGMGIGLSLGIVMRAGASTGGMDIPPLILKKLFSIPVSAALWAFDFCILLAQLLFHTPEDLLYGIVLIIAISLTLNKVLLFGTSRTEIKIVSEKAEQIRPLWATVTVSGDCDTDVIFTDVATGKQYIVGYVTHGTSEKIRLEKGKWYTVKGAGNLTLRPVTVRAA